MTKLHELHHHRPLTAVGVVICFLGLLALAYSITLHDIPLAMNNDMFAILHLTQTNLNDLHSDYQYYLVVFMILSGLVVDIAGPRTVLVFGITISIVANYLFIQLSSNPMILSCRFLINISHLFILIGALTLGTHWLPRRYFSLFVGLFTAILIMTPMIVFPYLHEMLTLNTLQGVFWAINACGVLVILGILLTARFTDNTRYRHTITGLFAPLINYKVWLIGVVAMLGWASNTVSLAFGTFYLIKRFTLDPANAFEIIRTASISFAFGALFMGILSDFMGERRYLISISYCLAAASFSFLMYMHSLSNFQASGLLFLTVFFTSSLIICYRKSYDYCTLGNSGITMGLILSMSIIGSIVFSHKISSLLHGYATAALTTNLFSWQLVLGIVPLLLLLGAGISAILLQPPPLKPIIVVPVVRD